MTPTIDLTIKIPESIVRDLNEEKDYADNLETFVGQVFEEELANISTEIFPSSVTVLEVYVLVDASTIHHGVPSLCDSLHDDIHWFLESRGERNIPLTVIIEVRGRVTRTDEILGSS